MDGLAYDWVHNNLYWTDSMYNQIGIVSLDTNDQGKFKSRILIESYLDSPHGIAVDPGKR